MNQRRCVEALFAGLLVAGVLLTPSPASALPPLPGDRDADDVSDVDETNVYHSDPNKRDTDGDGINDGNEVNNEKSSPTSLDTDGDGLSDHDEYFTWHTMLYLGDTDQDGSTDKQEVDAGTKPLDSASHPGAAANNPGGGGGGGENQGRADNDQDGLFNDDETNVYGTNPKVADTDGDGRDDGQEVFENTDPKNPFD
jgi:Bacterial TSP3 repeat